MFVASRIGLVNSVEDGLISVKVVSSLAES